MLYLQFGARPNRLGPSTNAAGNAYGSRDTSPVPEGGSPPSCDVIAPCRSFSGRLRSAA